MGATLIRRGQPCTATLPGLRLIRHHDEVALLQSQLTIDLPQLHTDPATIRIAVHADSLATWVIPALAETSDMLFHLDIDDQDCSQDWLNAAKYPPPSPSTPALCRAATPSLWAHSDTTPPPAPPISPKGAPTAQQKSSSQTPQPLPSPTKTACKARGWAPNLARLSPSPPTASRFHRPSSTQQPLASVGA